MVVLSALPVNTTENHNRLKVSRRTTSDQVVRRGGEMPWCTVCSQEYKSRVKKCPDCGTTISKGPGLTKPVDFMNRGWYAVRSLEDHNIAESLRDFLESNGYNVAIQNGNGQPEKGSDAGTHSNTSLMILVTVENAANAAKLIRSNTKWLNGETDPIVEEVETEDYGYRYEEDLIYDDDSIISSRLNMSGMDEFDNM